MTTILLVEDDERLVDMMQRYLQKNEFTVEIETRGDRAVDRILKTVPDLIVLDLMLPGLTGLEICRQIRPKYSKPIIMLTAMGEDIDQVVGLELGADDYIPKPIKPRLLLARIRAALRSVAPNLTSELNHNEPNNSVSKLIFGNLEICRSSYEVYVDKILIKMSNMEFELLWLLANNAGTILSRDDILSSLRGIGYDGMNRFTDVTISRLRKKIGSENESSNVIKTIHRKGYLFSVDGLS
ncbi:MAG: response regulator [Thiohalomonadales bacterium]